MKRKGVSQLHLVRDDAASGEAVPPERTVQLLVDPSLRRFVGDESLPSRPERKPSFDQLPSFERLKRWSSSSKNTRSSSSVMVDFCREIKPGLDSLDVKPTSSEASSRRNASLFMSPKSARWSARNTLTRRGGRKSNRKRNLSTSGILPPSIEA
jgi:hypothetical protein